MEVRLVDKLGTSDGRDGRVGEFVGQLVLDHTVLPIDLERELAAPGAEDGAGTGAEDRGSGGTEAGRDHFLESRELDPKPPVVGRARRGGDEGEKAGRRHDGPDTSVHPFCLLQAVTGRQYAGYLCCSGTPSSLP